MGIPRAGPIPSYAATQNRLFVEETGKTVMVISRGISLVSGICDSGAVMYGGHIRRVFS